MNIIKRIYRKTVAISIERKCVHCHKSAVVDCDVVIYNFDNLIMEEQTNLNAGTVIMNTRAKFVMKKWSGAAIGLTVITGNHISIPGKSHKMVSDKDKDEIDIYHEADKDVIVEEDVWIASNVTLLSGTCLGRGCIVGAGSVVRSIVPPYAIVAGNPAKVIGFRFTPKEMAIHEASLMPENDRIPIDVLQKNYEKYYLKRIRNIKDYIMI